MRRGERFENDCYSFLKNKYTTENCSFELSGGMDSTVSDIAVLKNDVVDFYIEAKMGNAQSGQFVILPNKEKKLFYFSPKNKSEENDFTKIILAYVNDNYETFSKAGTAGEDINIDDSVFSNWIINHYKQKNVKYIMTYHSGYIIFPVEKFQQYFTISATARNKGSGSGEVPKKSWSKVSNYVMNAGYGITKTCNIKENKKNRLLAYSSKYLDKIKFVFEELAYMFSSRPAENEYEIRKLNTKTKNTTVIFSISIKRSQSQEDLACFEKELNS